MTEPTCLALRLAGPLQSWGYRSKFAYRETGNEPTKSGVIGLLAAADGRRRDDPIKDLVNLRFGVRVDQPGTILRDYHTVSDYQGRALPSTKVDAKGRQKRTPYYTQVSERFYLQDAVFVAVVEGERDLLEGLADAIRQPGFPLALGRRACVPTLPILLTPQDEDLDEAGEGALWSGDLQRVLQAVPWKAAAHHRQKVAKATAAAGTVSLSVTYDEPDTPGAAGDDPPYVVADVPSSFMPKERAFSTRNVRREQLSVAVEFSTREQQFASSGSATSHDPLALLGW